MTSFWVKLNHPPSMDRFDNQMFGINFNVHDVADPPRYPHTKFGIYQKWTTSMICWRLSLAVGTDRYGWQEPWRIICCVPPEARSRLLLSDPWIHHILILRAFWLGMFKRSRTDSICGIIIFFKYSIWTFSLDQWFGVWVTLNPSGNGWTWAVFPW